MLEIVEDRIKIERYSDGFLITIKNKNWVNVGGYKTPCFVRLQDQRLLELHNTYCIDHSTMNKEVYEGEQFEILLPKILEFGELLARNSDNSPIFDLTKEKE